MALTKKLTIHSLNGFLKFVVVCLAILNVVFVILITVGCAKQCEKCNDRFVEVKVPVPQKCDFALWPKPDINTSTMKGVYESVTELSLDGVKLRKEIELIPCINLIFKGVK